MVKKKQVAQIAFMEEPMATIAFPAPSVLATERRFFSGLAIVLAVTTLIGFAPTYYLVTIFDGTTTRGVAADIALTPMVHLHGFTGSIWMLLLVTQTSLVTADRRDIHMRLGLLAIPVAAAIAVTALTVAFEAARRGSVPPGWTPPQFLLIQFGTLAGFLVFATLGLLWRRYSDYHKRLMMLATISMMVPVCGRIWRMLGGGEIARGAIGGMILSDLFVLVLVLYDWKSRGRLHPVTLWGGAALIAAQPFRVLFSETEQWQSVGRWLIG